MSQLLVVSLIGLFIGTNSLLAQSDSILEKKLLRKARPVYINIAVGFGFSNMRDFATSPLIYKGSIFSVGLERTRVDLLRESEFGVNYNFGTYAINVDEHINVSSVNTISLYYSQLYQLKSISSEEWNFKVGGLINVLGNMRINNAFQNNTQGVEFIPTLFISTSVTKDLTREEEKEIKFLFLNFSLPARRRDLSFRLNVGVLNSSYRNGYAYTKQGAIVNDDDLFSGYEFLIGGVRISSSLDYTLFKSNKNAFRFSYTWEAMKTSDEYDQLEMAWHTLKFTLMFNANNK